MYISIPSYEGILIKNKGESIKCLINFQYIVFVRMNKDILLLF